MLWVEVASKSLLGIKGLTCPLKKDDSWKRTLHHLAHEYQACDVYEYLREHLSLSGKT